VLGREHIQTREMTSVALADFMTRRAVPRKTTMIGLELSRDRFFTRNFDIPAAARVNLDRLVTVEIERKTPFHLGDIFVGQVARSLDDRQSKFRVEQWIVKRDIVERVADEVGLTVADIDFVRPAAAEEAAANVPTIVFQRNMPTFTWFRKTLLIMGGIACLLALIGVAGGQWRQYNLATTLDAEIATAASKAAAIRKLADQASRESGLLGALRAEKALYPPLADLLEEVSRILPDGTWVAEFRLKESHPGERAITISGFSDSAADLVALMDGSQLFSGTSLTAPITPDPNEHRERFALETQVTAASMKAR
jgi:general secretion pathway protein L